MNITAEVKWHLGEKDHAYLKYAESGRSFSIDIVLVPPAHRGAGIGRQLIERVLCLADSLGKDVYLSARPIGQASKDALERLILYYQRFGFVVQDRALTTAYMRRPARVPAGFEPLDLL